MKEYMLCNKDSLEGEVMCIGEREWGKETRKKFKNTLSM